MLAGMFEMLHPAALRIPQSPKQCGVGPSDVAAYLHLAADLSRNARLTLDCLLRLVGSSALSPEERVKCAGEAIDAVCKPKNASSCQVCGLDLLRILAGRWKMPRRAIDAAMRLTKAYSSQSDRHREMPQPGKRDFGLEFQDELCHLVFQSGYAGQLLNLPEMMNRVIHLAKAVNPVRSRALCLCAI
jgi:hypothetical protein